MAAKYDILILGSGPIGAATAYFLAEKGIKNIGVVTQDPTDDNSATYTNAGGSVRWYWDDPLKIEMTKQTADYAKRLSEGGVDLSLHEDFYVFLHKGVTVPAINIAGKKLVEWWLDEAQKKGVTLHQKEVVESVAKIGTSWTVKTNKGSYAADKVLLAMGVANSKFMPDYKLDLEKRELFVLDIEPSNDQASFPHTIVPLGEGVAYVFIKKTPNGLRFVVGQEDVVEASEEAGGEDYFGRLLEAGLGDVMPFLREAKVEKIWWGFDADNKVLRLEENDGLYAANCGSAIRGSVWIGRKIADELSA